MFAMQEYKGLTIRFQAPYCHTCGTAMVATGDVKLRYSSRDGLPYFVQWFKCPRARWWELWDHFDDCDTAQCV